MNWKEKYKLINVLLLIVLAIQLYFGVRFYSFSISSVIYFFGIICYFAYIHYLNKSIDNKSINSSLKNLEYASYVFLVITIFQILRYLFYLFSYFKSITFSLSLFNTLLNISIISLMIHSFFLRKKTFGRYSVKKNDELNNDSEILNQESFRTTEQRLELCKICLNKKFDKHEGLVCSLTLKKPSFDNFCEDFDLDKKEHQKRQLSRKVEKSNTKSGWFYVILIIAIIRILIRIFRNN